MVEEKFNGMASFLRTQCSISTGNWWCHQVKVPMNQPLPHGEIMSCDHACNRSNQCGVEDSKASQRLKETT